MLIRKEWAIEARLAHYRQMVPQVHRWKREAELRGDTERMIMLQGILNKYLSRAVMTLIDNGYTRARVARETKLTYQQVRRIVNKVKHTDR